MPNVLLDAAGAGRATKADAIPAIHPPSRRSLPAAPQGLRSKDPVPHGALTATPAAVSPGIGGRRPRASELVNDEFRPGELAQASRGRPPSWW
jgi:hypothetical protein